MRPGYRSDIDGLRAVAVLAVVVYHAVPAWLPGGYVGVDIFFAISGYLIGGLLIEEASTARRVDLAGFYERRALRILPAFLVVLCATYAAGLRWLTPDKVGALGRHGLASAAFVENLVLWREAGYFDVRSQFKPLLHLWSLAIEEQFYLVAPLLVGAVVRATPRVGLAFFGLAAASLVACWTCDDPVAAFYGPMYRCWEIGFGVALAGLSRAHGLARARLGEVTSLAGALCVAASLARFSADGGAPVAANVLPLAGACLLLASPTARLNRRLLSHPIAVFVGKISYPLYLWHWPILAIRLSVRGSAPTPGEAAAWMALALALATATWRFVETPLRTAVPRRRVALGLALALAAVGAAGWVLKDRHPTSASSLGRHDERDVAWFAPDASCLEGIGVDPARIAGATVFCSMSGRPEEVDALVVGDSTANSLYPGVAAALGRRGLHVANLGAGMCAPLIPGQRNRLSPSRACDAMNERALAFALEHPRVRWVLLSFLPSDFKYLRFDGEADDVDERARFGEGARRLLAGIARLRAAGKTVVLSFDAPSIGGAIDRCRSARVRAEAPAEVGDACVLPVGQLSMREPYLGWLRHDLGSADACAFSQTDALRGPGGAVRIVDDVGLLFRDDHHLTRHGSAVVAESLLRSGCGFASH